MKDRYVIGISSIGSGVGQSVINSCRISNLPLQTVGLGNNPFAYGAYDCDEYDYIPTIYSNEYIDELIRKCHEYKIDLLIPGLDDEALMLSREIHKFHAAGINVILSDQKLIDLSRDKEAMTKEFNNISDIFVDSYNKENIFEALSKQLIQFPLIAKPKAGFASRGTRILKTKEEIEALPNNFIIQELAIPAPQDPNYENYYDHISDKINLQVSEISIQLVTDKKGNLLGKMASYNKLSNGVPIEILPIENRHIWEKIDHLLPALTEMGMRGPLNLQGRLTPHGLKLFEINPRFTGITYLRALMGFNEVEACIRSWLNIEPETIQLSLNHNRFGVRQTADKAISLNSNSAIKELSRTLNNKLLKPNKSILVTGANGFLGHTLCTMLLDRKQPVHIYALVRDKKNVRKKLKSPNINYHDYHDIRKGNLPLASVETLIHCAFGRNNRSYQEIAESLRLTNEILTLAAMNQVPEIINISSQSVYDLTRRTIYQEGHAVTPNSAYAQGKYASELIMSNLSKFNKQTSTTSLRMASLCGGQPGMQEEEIIAQFVKQALNKQPLHIIGGTQTFEKLDVRDASSAIISILETPTEKWKEIYNVASGNPISITEIARQVVNTASRYNGGFHSQIHTEEKHVNRNMHLNVDQFKNDTGWVPYFSLNDIIISLIEYYRRFENN